MKLAEEMINLEYGLRSMKERALLSRIGGGSDRLNLAIALLEVEGSRFFILGLVRFHCNLQETKFYELEKYFQVRY